MRLLIVALIITVLCVCIEAKICWSPRHCGEGETCVYPRYFFWGWWRRSGVCKPTEGQCKTGEDCKPNECCESKPQVKGRKKRQIGGSNGVCKPLQSSGKNSCKRLCRTLSGAFSSGERSVGRKCILVHQGIRLLDRFETSTECLIKYPAGKPESTVQRCPCTSDLTCEPDGRREIPQGLTGVCRKPKTCTTGTDCGPDECCESTAPLKGRKKRQTGGNGGVCKPLQSSGNKCLIKYPAGKPESTVLRCPCTSDLTCAPDGGRDIPQGLTGVCREPKPCTTGADCGPNECCESTAQLKGRKKRQIGGNNGVCKPLQSSGNRCLIQYPSGKPSTTVLQCPCTSDLRCSPDGGRLVPQGYTGVCRPPVACTDGNICNPHECCKSVIRPIGRRKRQAGGECSPMGTPGASCLTLLDSGKPESMVPSCPCKSGSACQGSGVFDVPLGEIGTCE